MGSVRLGVFAAVAAGLCAVAANSTAARLAGGFRCDRLLTPAYLKTVTGRSYAASAANAKQRGASVTCVFNAPAPPMPPGFGLARLHGRVIVTATSRPADLATIERTYKGKLHPLPGLGSHADETVSAYGTITIVASTARSAITIRHYGAAQITFTEQIARRVYAAAAA